MEKKTQNKKKKKWIKPEKTEFSVFGGTLACDPSQPCGTLSVVTPSEF